MVTDPDIFDMTFSGQSQNMKAARKETTVQDGISTFVRVKPLDVFHEILRHFPAVCSNTMGYFDETLVQSKNITAAKPETTVQEGILLS